MKLVTFTSDSSRMPRLGALLEEKVLDLSSVDPSIPGQMLSFIEAGSAALEKAARSIATPKETALLPLSKIRLLAPIPNPPSLKDFLAFEDHAKAGAARRGEQISEEWYEIPAYYKGNNREIYGPFDTIPWPSYTRKLDFECEIACVVGRKGRDLSLERAKEHIFGYMIFNDFSARDIQRKEMKLRTGPNKAKDFANSIGPWLVTADETGPCPDFEMTVRVNGSAWSQGRFRDQRWGFPLLISHVSQEETVYPGDILGSGTFYKGCGMDMDRWIQPGDRVELEVPGLGRLVNTVGRPTAEKDLNYKESARRPGVAA